VAEKLSKEHKPQKSENQAMFRRDQNLQNLRLLTRQGLRLCGYGDGADSNFVQFLYLHGFDAPVMLTWMSKKTDKYTSSDIQNECLEIMALNIL
jgi:hypothetical protein